MREPRHSGRVVCLGEAIVDLVCPEPVSSLAEASEFVPGLGGSLANVAAVASRFGAEVAFAGGAGGDDWGRWLRDRLAEQGVDVAGFVLAPGTTSLAFVAVSEGGEPSFAFYEASERPAAYAEEGIGAALGGDRPGVLVLGSDTLLEAAEREVTLYAADLAHERGWTVLADPNLRPARWAERGHMHVAVGELVARAEVVKCNGAEARELTGRDDEDDAAQELLARGPDAVIVTLGAKGALVATARDERIAEVPAGQSVAVMDATGAGDSVTGVVAAALAAGASPAALDAVVAVAMRAAAGVVGRWGSIAGLPEARQAEALLVGSLTPPPIGSG